ncbi:hypothetical protein [Nocardioides sp.]|uniref:hypothetical protein n=1 Tax=Nocardioides sp. TaxID=35761 RepID=UPI002735D125|nr:hypothetical protein [Nocardioides sp.]MDP3890717.1 hypothetical protein [Nocardioides sp.]
MTTATQHRPGRPGARVLLGAAVVALGAGLVLSVAGALTRGSAAGCGALVGTLLAVGVFALGAFTINLVAGVMPSASLLVAMLTYTLQVVLMALVLIALSGSGALDGGLDRGWLAGAVITATLVWLLCQIVLVTRARIPAYDLPQSSTEAGAR